MPILLRLQEFQGKGDEEWKEESLWHRFPADPKIVNAWEKMCFGETCSTATSSRLLPDTR